MQMVARVEDSMQIPAFRDQPAPLIVNRDRLGPPFNFLLYLTPFAHLYPTTVYKQAQCRGFLRPAATHDPAE